MITVNSKTEFLSDAVFDHFLDRHTELPQWLVNQKQASWTEYLELPAPSRKMETWRFANVNGLGVESFRLAQPVTDEDARSLADQTKSIQHTAGKLVFGNDDLILEEKVSEDLKSKGVTG